MRTPPTLPSGARRDIVLRRRLRLVHSDQPDTPPGAHALRGRSRGESVGEASLVLHADVRNGGHRHHRLTDPLDDPARTSLIYWACRYSR
ncbi:hypothetical protein M2161_001502 [Streptomyces sp. SAI-133]|uniref:hypothetical protein n=1 Tax=unclassified Streptomyces TaxID=2593676 RepID=UPI00247415D0|nr:MULTISPECIES: hypothetical protein [unclassified Streptomyces]MDH6553562.1 hypothetical protein [Streptomyces sp. SAI-041]MDH6582396.1 hypothetical protein [Streptomyces sp. SAI-133]